MARVDPHPRIRKGRSRPRGAARPRAADGALILTAYRLFASPFSIHPAPPRRAWMDETDDRFAYRCLPLVIANQAGWIVTAGSTVVATWDGSPEPSGVVVDSPDGGEPPASGHFGHGILTWEVPFLLRTPPGYNLLVRGPANSWKDGAVPLEGLVETDWAVATFTVNWRLTRPRVRVRFEPDDAICMLVPQRRGELEAFRARIRPIASAARVRRDFRVWARDRDRLLARLDAPGWPEDASTPWQLHYLRGTSPSGMGSTEHQTKLHLSPFVEDAAPAPSRSREPRRSRRVR